MLFMVRFLYGMSLITRLTHCILVCLLLSGSLTAPAQRLRWERTFDGPTGTIDAAMYLRQAAPNLTEVSGCTVNNNTPVGRRFPGFILRYDSLGAEQDVTFGRLLGTGEQAVLPLRRGRLWLAAVQVPTGPFTTTAVPFAQRLTEKGDTLPGAVTPRSRFEGFGVAARRDVDSVRVAAIRITNNSADPYAFALLHLDTTGTVQRVSNFPNPTATFVNAYTASLLPTYNHHWLLVGHAQQNGNGYNFHPYLVEADATGRRRRFRYLPLLGTGHEEILRTFNNALVVRDGSGYVLSGRYTAQPPNGPVTGFVAKLDTALNLVWVTQLPAQATPNLHTTKVRELPDGSLVVLAGDDAAPGYVPTGQLHFFYLSRTGQVLGRRSVRSSACQQLRLYDLLLLPGGGAVVSGGYASCGTQRSVAYVARLDSVMPPRTVTTSLAPRTAWLTAAYPNPATNQLTLRLRVAPATRTAELRFYDLSGRLHLTVPVPARGEQLELTASVRQLPTGLYGCVLLLDGQPTQPHRLSILH